MLEIFIPTKIINYGEINKFTNKLKQIIEKNFEVKISDFSSGFFEGIYLDLENFDEDLIVLLNGEFGSFYFLDYDYLKYNNVSSFGIKIVKIEELSKELEKIFINITGITADLNSNNLLTNTKKEEIKNKINLSFFSLSGVIFVLYKLLEKVGKNKETLQNYTGKVEYEGQAVLLNETNITKEVELKAMIEKLENRVGLFIEAIKKIF